MESYDEGIEEYKAILEYKKEGNYIPQSDIEYAIERIKWAYQIQNKQKNLLDFVENLFENYFNLDLLANDVYAQYVELAENLGREYYKEALLNAVIFHDDENGIDSLTSDEEPEQYCLDALERLADIYLGEKDYYEAEKYLSAVVQWKEDPEILRNLSRIYIRQGQIGAAEEFLDKAKLKEPENVTEWELTAEIQIKKREFKEAKETAENGIKLLQEMNEQNPANSEKISRAIEYLYLKKIDALVNLLQTEDALDELEIARRRFPKTEIFYAYSAILLFLSDRMKETEELINSAENAGINISEKMKDLREAVKSKSKRDKKQK